MAAVRLTTFQLGLMLATVSSLSLLPSAGWAYTAEEQQACTGDAFRLCSSEIPDVDKVTACMVQKKAQLSPGCRVFFRNGPAEAAAGEPATIKPAMARKPSRKSRHVKRDDT